MKKQYLILIALAVVAVGLFIASDFYSSSKIASTTTAVADGNGTIHYYEPVTEKDGSIVTTEENSRVYAEIETQADGKSVTKKNGTYVTNENTTVLPDGSMTEIENSTTKPVSKGQPNTASRNISDADNEIDFEPEPSGTTTVKSETNPTENTTAKATENTTEMTTQSATDKDGWITKWY